MGFLQRRPHATVRSGNRSCLVVYDRLYTLSFSVWKTVRRDIIEIHYSELAKDLKQVVDCGNWQH